MSAEVSALEVFSRKPVGREAATLNVDTRLAVPVVASPGEAYIFKADVGAADPDINTLTEFKVPLPEQAKPGEKKKKRFFPTFKEMIAWVDKQMPWIDKFIEPLLEKPVARTITGVMSVAVGLFLTIVAVGGIPFLVVGVALIVKKKPSEVWEWSKKAGRWIKRQWRKVFKEKKPETKGEPVPQT